MAGIGLRIDQVAKFILHQPAVAVGAIATTSPSLRNPAPRTVTRIPESRLDDLDWLLVAASGHAI
jgi:hypothetical protein